MSYIEEIAKGLGDFARWLSGGDGKDWYTCSGCNGSGFYVVSEHETEGHQETPGNHADSVTERNGYHNARRVWCRDCRGMGAYHYIEAGRRIPGKGDEFDKPAAGRVDYRQYIKSQEWRNRANICKAHAGWRCQECGRHESEVTLDAHHLTYERLGYERLSDLVALCRDCHNRAEKARKRNNGGR